MLTFLRPTLVLTRSWRVASLLYRFPVTICPNFVPVRPSAGGIPCLHQHDLWPVSRTSQQLWRNSNSDQPIAMPTYQQNTLSHGHGTTNWAPRWVWNSTAKLQVCILRAYSLHILISFYCFVLNCTLHNTGEKKSNCRKTDYASMSQTKFGQLYFCTCVLGSAVLSGLVGILVFTCSIVFIPHLLFYFSGCGFFLSPVVLLHALHALFLTLAPPSFTFTPSAPLFVLRVASPDSLHRGFSAAVPPPALNSLVSSACLWAPFVFGSDLEFVSLRWHLLTTCILHLCGPWL